LQPIVYGNTAEWKGRVEGSQKYMKWTVFVRSPFNHDISSFVRSVIFELHEDFHPNKRVVNEPPYEITEEGWGQFNLKITINFRMNDVNPVLIIHRLGLLSPDEMITANIGKHESFEVCDELLFVQPSSQSLKILDEVKENCPEYTSRDHMKNFQLQERLISIGKNIEKIGRECLRVERKNQATDMMLNTYYKIINDRKKIMRGEVKQGEKQYLMIGNEILNEDEIKTLENMKYETDRLRDKKLRGEQKIIDHQQSNELKQLVEDIEEEQEKGSESGYYSSQRQLEREKQWNEIIEWMNEVERIKSSSHSSSGAPSQVRSSIGSNRRSGGQQGQEIVNIEEF
ncbi:MAG: putative YEATS family protein, partial [Streblomastix strix]